MEALLKLRRAALATRPPPCRHGDAWVDALPARPADDARALGNACGTRCSGGISTAPWLCWTANASPAGAAIMTGSEFPLDRERTAELLGFDRLLTNTLDAVQSTDDLFEAASVVAITGADLTRLAADLQLFFSTELRYVDVPDRYCGTSSIMPQKRNPAWMGEAKAAGGNTVGTLVSVLTMGNGPTGGPIQERNAAERDPLRHVEDAHRSPGGGHRAPSRCDPRRRSARRGRPPRTGWRRRISPARSSESGASTGAAPTRSSASWCGGARSKESLQRPSRPRSWTKHPSSTWTSRSASASRSSMSRLDPVACVSRRTGVGGPAAPTHLAQLDEDVIELDQDQRRLDEVKAKVATAARGVGVGDRPAARRAVPLRSGATHGRAVGGPCLDVLRVTAHRSTCRQPDRSYVRQPGGTTDAVLVRKIPFESVTDTSGLLHCIERGDFTGEQIVAIVGKTEGNGGVNDFSRILADRVLRDFLVEHGGRDARGRGGAGGLVRRLRRRDRAAHDRVRRGARRGRSPTSRASRSASPCPRRSSLRRSGGWRWSRRSPPGCGSPCSGPASTTRPTCTSCRPRRRC